MYRILHRNLNRSPVRSTGDVWRVLNLGAGVQSTTVLLLSLRGLLPRFDVCLFADTQYEPAEVYGHLAWLEGEAARADTLVLRLTAGNLRQDAIDFRQNRQSADGRRYANIPAYVEMPGGKAGMMRRQCTSEYKIRPIEDYIRAELLGLGPRQRAPRVLRVEQWFGISADEPQRQTYPGRWKKTKSTGLFGQPVTSGKEWSPALWKHHCYPLTRRRWLPERKIERLELLPRDFDRQACRAWLAENYPDRVIPRSACVCCPFRSNDEWRQMRDSDPASWADAVDFDGQIRLAEAANRIGLTPSGKRGLPLGGLPYLHRQMVPLPQVDLGGEVGREQHGGCGSLLDGEDGHCDV